MLTLTFEDCRLYSVSQRSARWPATASGLVHRTAQRGVPTRLAHADGILSGRRQPSGHVIRMSYQRVSNRGARRSTMSSIASSDRETLLPFTPEALLVAVPILIVGIPWAVNHLQLLLVVAVVTALSPFGTVIWSLVPPSLGKSPARPQQPPQGPRPQAAWQSKETSQPFWPVQGRLLREPPLVVEADVLGPSYDAPQSRNRSRNSDSYTAQTMPHMAPAMAQGAHRRSSYTAGERLSAPLDREAQRRQRRMGQAALYDNGDAARATFSRTTSAAAPMQQQAAHESATLAEPTVSGFWETKPWDRRRRSSLWVKVLRRVPFVKSWGGLL